MQFKIVGKRLPGKIGAGKFKANRFTLYMLCKLMDQSKIKRGFTSNDFVVNVRT